MDAFTEYVALEVVNGYADSLYTDGTRFRDNEELAAELRAFAEEDIVAAVGFSQGVYAEVSLRAREFVERALAAVEWDDVADHYADDLVEE